MTNVVIAPRVENLTSDTESVLTGCWVRVRPSKAYVAGGQWVLPVWPSPVPIQGSSITALLDPLPSVPYELEITGPDGNGGQAVLVHEFRIVPSGTTVNWWDLTQVTGPSADPVLTSTVDARLTALEAAVGSVSGGASNLASITDMSAFMRTVNDDTSASAARTTLGAAATSHTHVATTDLTATGTKSSSTFLRGDDTWAAPPAAGSPAWTDITGKPSTFAPTLPIAQSGVTNLVSDLSSLTARVAALETGAGTPVTPVGEQILTWSGSAYGTYDTSKLVHRFVGGPDPATLGYSLSANDIWEPPVVAPPASANLITIGSATHVLDGTDVARGAGQMIRYTSSATQAVTPTNQFGVEVTVNSSTGLVTAVNSRIQSGSTTGTSIPSGSYVLSGHGGPGAEEPGQWLLANAVVGAAVALSTGTVTNPNPNPTGSSGLPAKVVGVWHHRWSGPNLGAYPSDVKSLVNLVSSGLAQSGGSGTGTLSYAPLNGQSVADHAADIRSFNQAGRPVLLGFGGSSDGGITITTDATADQAYNSIVSYVGTYGFAGIDIDLEPSGSNWTQSALLRLCQKLKTQFGSGFIIGTTVGLYDVWTTRWSQFMVAAGSNVDYISVMLYDFVEASDSRLTSVSVQKCDLLTAAGVPQSKIILAYMMRPNPGYTNSTPTTDLVVNAWNAAKAKYPNLRGVTVWEDLISVSRNWDFVRNVGPVVGPSSTATAIITAFTATATSGTGITLNWTTSGTATWSSFAVKRNGVIVAASLGSAIRTYADSGLTAGTSYSYELTGTTSTGSTVTATVTGTTTAPTGPVTGTWLSGGSGEGVGTGAFATWRGEAVPVMATWASDNTNMVNIWPLQSGFEYGSWTGSGDVSIGAINQSESGVLGSENWANAASGSYDSRWTASLNKLKTEWTRISRGTCYIRFAHEWNGNWYGWSVTQANITNFINAWRRFRGLQQSIFPAAKLVFCPNGGTSGQTYDWRTAWPGDTYVDVCATDWYSFAWADSRTVDQYGGPIALEQHRQFALAHGKPFAVPEWGVAFNETGDVPAYITFMNNFFRTNAGTGAGQVLYDCYFNVIWSPNNFGLYPRAQSLSPNSSDRYQQLSWGV